MTPAGPSPSATTTRSASSRPRPGRSPLDNTRFTGHERDFLGLLNVEGSDYLDYMHARFYEPNKGRFLSPDPVRGERRRPQSWNGYSYVLNNPLALIDPTGRVACDPGVPADGSDDCVQVEAVDPWREAIEEAQRKADAFMSELMQHAANVSTGFADTITFKGTKKLREHTGDHQVVNPCSAFYTGGQLAGVLWWTAAGGAVGGKLGGGNLAARELGNITLTNYAERGLATLSAADKLAALGGTRGAIVQALKNAANPAWWATVLRTTATTGPTPAGSGGVVGLGVGGASVVNSLSSDNC